MPPRLLTRLGCLGDSAYGPSNSQTPQDARVQVPAPASRLPGRIGALKCRLRPTDPARQIGSFCRQTALLPSRPGPLLDVTHHTREPDPGAATSGTTARQIEATGVKLQRQLLARSQTGSIGGPVRTYPMPPSASLHPGDRSDVARAMRSLFTPEKDCAKLVDRWVGIAHGDDAELSRLMSGMLSLARVCDGDPQRAMAALDALASPAGPGPQDDTQPSRPDDIAETSWFDAGDSAQGEQIEMTWLDSARTSRRAWTQPLWLTSGLPNDSNWPLLPGAADIASERHLVAQATADAFRFQIELAATGLGLRTLLEAMGSLPVGTTLTLQDHQKKEAVKVELRAAQHLMSQLSAQARRPQNLDEARLLAYVAASQPIPETVPQDVRDFADSLGERDRRTLREGAGMVGLAMLCGTALRSDAAANPPLDQKEAYFAFRMRLLETSRGRVPDLDKVKAELFKGIMTDSERAVSADSIKLAGRVLGSGKSAMEAVKLGSSAARLRHTHEDFAAVDVVDTLVARLNVQIRAADGLPVTDATVRKAVRVATAVHYKRKLSQDGWHNEVDVSMRMRNAIAADAARALGLDQAEVRRRFPLLSGFRYMNASTLRDWAVEELVPKGNGAGGHLDHQLTALKRLETQRDALPAEWTPANMLSVVRTLIEETRNTFDLKHLGGSSAGLHLNTGIAKPFEKAVAVLTLGIGAPVLIATPDIRGVRGRYRMLNIGSSAQGGVFFVGTSTRTQFHAGAGVMASWPALFGFATTAVGGQVVPYSRETDEPEGVMIRTRMQRFAPAQHPGIEPWREKLLEVYDAMTTAGRNGDVPANAHQMWQGLVEHSYKDPDVTVNWLAAKSTKTTSSGGFQVSARFGAREFKIGPAAGNGVSHTWSSKTTREDLSGVMKVHNVASNRATEATAAFALNALGAGIAGNATDGRLQLPAVAGVGLNLSLMTTFKGVTLRLAEDDDGIIPDTTLRDVEFGSVHDFLTYVDSRNADWAFSATVDPDSANPAATTTGQARLNQYTSRVKASAHQGTELFVERQSIKAAAALAYSQLGELNERLSSTDTAGLQDYKRTALAAALLPLGNDARSRNFDSIDAAMSWVMLEPHNWRNRFLYVMEDVRTAKTVGNQYIGVVAKHTEVSHLHMTSALAARPEQPLEPLSSGV